MTTLITKRIKKGEYKITCEGKKYLAIDETDLIQISAHCPSYWKRAWVIKDMDDTESWIESFEPNLWSCKQQILAWHKETQQ